MKKMTLIRKNLTRKCMAAVSGFLIVATTVKANNVSVSNLQYLPATQELQFDISWDNSWRNTGTTGSTENYDGVWVFAKYRDACAKDSVFPSASSYKPMWFSATGHTIPTGATGELGATNIGGTNRNLGIFLYRSTDGSGTFSLTGVKLKWDATAQGITHSDWDIQLFAIEMVHIPQGAFYVGDGISSYTYREGNTSNPFLISSENAINIGQSAGMLSFQSITSTSGSINNDYPKGYDAFWSMKYEITQKQYVDYLNTLSRADQAIAAPNVSTYLVNGTTSVPAANRGAFDTWVTQRGTARRNGIRIDGPTGNVNATIDPSKPVNFVCDLNESNAGNASDDGQTIACNYLTISELYRYLDWAGLRPMNDFEYEKICRGPAVSPPYIQIPYEMPWGLGGNIAGNYTLSGAGMNNAGTGSESLITTGNGLVVGGTASGPRRVGITYGGSTSRITAGSSYYGVADMAGNVEELVISLNMRLSSHPTYTRDSYGDGVMGSTFVTGWPTSNSTSSAAYTTKGSHFAYTSWPNYCISINFGSSSTTTYYRNSNSVSSQASVYLYYTGGRGVRGQGNILP